jgi:hypothetical protein
VKAEKLREIYAEHFGAGFKPEAAPNHKQIAAARDWLRTT